MKKLFLALTILSILIVTGCKKNIQEILPEDDVAVVKDASLTVAGQFVPNELLIKFKSGTSEKSRVQILSFINGRVSEHILTGAMELTGDNEGIYLVNTNTDVFAAIARMKGESNIEYAEPNWIYTHTLVSNDTYFTNGSLWGMYGPSTSPANQYGSQAATAWAGGTIGSGDVYVGIIDEGAMFDHSDLKANFWTNPFDPANGVDDDANGQIDDIHGWDFVSNDNTTFDGINDDHGTHVAGTIGAEKNGTGVVGVNWNIKMISAKFLGNSGGTTANAIKAVDYITNLKTRHGLNIVATNNSWGGGGFSQALQDAITRSGNEDILFIASAGNSGVNTDNSPSYPASYSNSNIISVAALTSGGGLASYSNYGATRVDLGAPGSGINSTIPVRKGNKLNAGYGSYSGTSMAAPHVTGAAALYASTHSGASAATIKNAILSATVPTSSLAGKCVSGGRLNVSGF